ncbi:MAG: amidohydrolase family protein, partial [Panacibacter sp.]
MLNIRFFITFLFVAVFSEAQKTPADLLVFNAAIYTIDQNFSVKEAMVIIDGKILETGNAKALKNRYAAKQELNAGGKFIYPGFIDAHAHFLGYGLGLQTVDLTGTKSWDEILERLKTYSAKYPKGWLIGRGWDQNDWENKEFPTREKLDQMFPGRPVFLTRVDGHAALVNEAALGKLTPADTISGGDLIVKDGKLTGILVDNAINLVSRKIPSPSYEQNKEALLNAQANCFAAGLTTIDDCGLDYSDVVLIEKLQQSNELKMRLYVMLSDGPNNYRQAFKRGIIKTDRLNVRSFKVYADGALGSRGACLLEPYADKPGNV